MRRIMLGMLVLAVTACDDEGLRGEGPWGEGLPGDEVEVMDGEGAQAMDDDGLADGLVDHHQAVGTHTCGSGSAVVHVWSWYEGATEEIKTKASCDYDDSSLGEGDSCDCTGDSSLSGTVNGGVCLLCSNNGWAGPAHGGKDICTLGTTKDVCLDFGDSVGYSYANEDGRVVGIDSETSWTLSQCDTTDSCDCTSDSEDCSCYNGYLDFSIVMAHGSGPNVELVAIGDPIIKLTPGTCTE